MQGFLFFFTFNRDHKQLPSEYLKTHIQVTKLLFPLFSRGLLGLTLFFAYSHNLYPLSRTNTKEYNRI